MGELVKKRRQYDSRFRKGIEGAFDDENIIASVKELCLSKVEEMQIYGYEGVHYEQVWACVTHKYIRGLPKMHRIVNDILSLNPTTFMNWLMLGVYKRFKNEARRELA